MNKFKIVRMYFNQTAPQHRVLKRGLTLEQAQSWCKDPETSSKTCKTAVNVAHTAECGPWFDSYTDDEYVFKREYLGKWLTETDAMVEKEKD